MPIQLAIWLNSVTDRTRSEYEMSTAVVSGLPAGATTRHHAGRQVLGWAPRSRPTDGLQRTIASLLRSPPRWGMRRLAAAALPLALIVTAPRRRPIGGRLASSSEGAVRRDDHAVLDVDRWIRYPRQPRRVDVLRLNLDWNRVAPKRPVEAVDPADPAYDWALYDRALGPAHERGIEVLLTIYGTPGWANGGKGQTYAPSNAGALRAPRAAATRC